MCDAPEFQYLPIGDSKTLLHVVPISRLREFAMDAKRVGLFALARFAICVEVALDRVASFRKQYQIEIINFHVVALAKSAHIRYVTVL